MADEATTSEADEQAQVDNTAELEREQTQTEAVESSEETSQTSEADDAEPEDESTDELTDNSDEYADVREWAAKKNLPLDDPLKIAKMYQEAEKHLGKVGQEKGQLTSAVSTANEETGTEDVQALKNEFEAFKFKVDNKVDDETEQVMVKILDERPWLAGDLDAVLEQAQGRMAKTRDQELLEARKTGGKEALATVAQRQRAAAPKSSASTRETPAQFLTDAEVGRLTPAEYQEAKAAGRIQY